MNPNMRYNYSSLIPLQLQVWLATDTYKKSENPKEISVTQLLKPTKSIILTERAKNQRDTAIAEGDGSLLATLSKPNLEGFVKSRMGTSIHDSVERAWKSNYRFALRDLGYDEDYINRIVINPTAPQDLPIDAIIVYTEKRLTREIIGYILTGEVDFIFDSIIQDLKSTSTYAFKYVDEDKHNMQMSIYRWIFTGNGINLSTKGQVNYLFTDWSPVTAARDPNYPPVSALGVSVDLASSEEVESFITNKIEMLEDNINTPEEGLIPCTPEELWQSESTWAFYASGDTSKRATNVGTYEEVVAKKNEKGTGIVVERPGMVKFCNYCGGSTICKQKDTYISAGLLEYNA